MHADMDAFYASVEQRDDPSLAGRPVAVGGRAPRGVIAAASYEARRFGVHSALPTIRAQQRCPELVLLPPRIADYQRVSAQVFEIFRRYSPLVEPLSLDEAFIDLTGTGLLHGEPLQIARQLRAAVREELTLTVSVGIGPNKFIAKIASDAGKPDGLVEVRADEVEGFVWPMPVGRLFGVGEATARILEDLGARTIGELARLPREPLRRRLGVHGDQLWELAHGLDQRPVVSDRFPESVGHEDTFTEDLAELDELALRIQDQADRVAHRLRKLGCRARTAVLKLKTARHKTHTRRARLPQPTADGTTLAAAVRPLLAEMLPRLGPLRLTGVTAADLLREGEPRQLTLDEPRHLERERLGEALDAIADRYGTRALVRGSMLDGPDDEPGED